MKVAQGFYVDITPDVLEYMRGEGMDDDEIEAAVRASMTEVTRGKILARARAARAKGGVSLADGPGPGDLSE